MADKRKAILLRITPELYERLNLWARDELRSVNAQIEYLLRDLVRRRFGRDLPAAEGDAPEADPPDEGSPPRDSPEN